MPFEIIAHARTRAKSKIALSLSAPEKRGSPRFYISIPTVISGTLGFDKVETCHVLQGNGADAGKLWVKPDGGASGRSNGGRMFSPCRLKPWPAWCWLITLPWWTMSRGRKTAA